MPRPAQPVHHEVASASLARAGTGLHIARITRHQGGPLHSHEHASTLLTHWSMGALPNKPRLRVSA